MPKPTTKTPWCTTYQEQPVTLPNGNPGLAPNKTQAPLTIQDSGVLYHEPLAGNWLNYQLDETYQWIDYFETTTDANLGDISALQAAVATNTSNIATNASDIATNASDIAANANNITVINAEIDQIDGPDVINTGWVKAQNTYYIKDISLNTLDVSTDVVENSNVLISQTGGGGDFIWTVLDDLPSNTKFLTLRFKAKIDNSSGTLLWIDVGASEPSQNPTDLSNKVMASKVKLNSDALLNLDDVSEVTIPVSNKQFRLFWDVTQLTSGTVTKDLKCYLVGYGV